MTKALARTVAALRALAPSFDAAARAGKARALQRIAGMPLQADRTLLRYHDSLLFLAAHPADAAQAAQVERELRRVATALRARRGAVPPALRNQGLPHVDTITRFSHDCVRWLLAQPDLRVELDAVEAPLLDFNAVLRLTLPTLEQADTQAGLDADALMQALQVPPRQRLPFLVAQLAALDAQPLVKDLLFDSLGLAVRVRPRSAALSKARNRLPMAQRFLATERLRRFDVPALLAAPLPRARPLDGPARDRVVGVVRRTMLLTARETDPATYLDTASLRVHDLERGLSVALYGMVPARQLPLESYVGFTLFKNGLPVAYGGAWLLGPRAAFGMNIFEPYRGGESGYMMGQVLRAYRQAFGVRWFEVDAYQFGLDNPDGIRSGAYWFYWRHGFRSVDPALAARAEREAGRIAQGRGHRSSAATLRAFTGSSVALDLGGPVPPALAELTAPVTDWIARHHDGDRRAATADAVRLLRARCAALGGRARLGLPARPDADQARVLAEVALLAQALAVQDARRLRLLAAMVRAKPRDVDRYQRLLLDFLEPASSDASP